MVISEAVMDVKAGKFLEDGDGGWILEAAVGLDETKRADDKRCLRGPQDNYCVKMCTVSSNVAEAFDLAESLLSDVERSAFATTGATKYDCREALVFLLKVARGKMDAA